MKEMYNEENAFFGGIITGASMCVIVFLIKRYFWCFRRQNVLQDRPPREFSTANEYILTLIARSDIPLVKSKLASHCSQASVLAFDSLLSSDPQAARFWLSTGQTKIIVAAESVDVLNKMDDLARRLDLISTFVCDENRTLIGPAPVTVLGIGPGPQNVVNRITYHLRIM